MKSPYYVATITNAYRKALEKSVDVQRLQKEIDCVSHRKFCTGFYFGQVAHGNNDIPYLQECVFSAVVQAYGDGRAVVEQRNKFQIGDELEILSPDHIGKRFRLQRMWDDQGQPLQVAQRVQQKVCIECPVELKAMDILRKRIRT